jgi:hypothetical protein
MGSGWRRPAPQKRARQWLGKKKKKPQQHEEEEPRKMRKTHAQNKQKSLYRL